MSNYVDIPQDGNLGTSITYMGYHQITSTTSNQYKLKQDAINSNRYSIANPEYFAMIDDCMVIATKQNIGNKLPVAVGDYVRVTFKKNSGGTAEYNCIIGDIKGSDADSIWGHSGGTSVVEMIYHDYNPSSEYIPPRNNPKTDVVWNNPWGRGRVIRITKIGNYWDGNKPVRVSNIGKDIVRIAKDQKGKPYVWGEESPDKGFDCSGLVYYCYNAAGKSIGRMTVEGYYNYYKNTAKSILSSDVVMAGDLLFYENDPNSQGLDHIAIATGSGTRIHAANSDRGVVEDNGLGNPTYILRILSDTETSQGFSPAVADTEPGISPEVYVSLTSNDPYNTTISQNLSLVQSYGYDYGYLIDMTNGGEFMFYIPDFTEQAGANWSDIEIRGRSVSIKAYESTASRSISISLNLYAGEGLYKARLGESGLDTVSRLHKDANFIKSLEYPDYSNAITRPPAVVHLILGASVNIAGVVHSVTVSHQKPLDRYNRAMYLNVSFTVSQIATNPIDYRDVRNAQYSLIDTKDIDSLGSATDDNILYVENDGADTSYRLG